MSFPIPESTTSLSSSAEGTCNIESSKPSDEDVFIAFARVFSGKIRVGQELFVLGPKHNPALVINKVSIPNY